MGFSRFQLTVSNTDLGLWVVILSIFFQDYNLIIELINDFCASKTNITFFLSCLNKSGE